MRVLKKQGYAFILFAVLIVALTLGSVFTLPTLNANAEEFIPDVTVSTAKDLKEQVYSAPTDGTEKKIRIDADIVVGNAEDNVHGEEWGLRVAGGRNITLDLNGHKISRANNTWVILNNVNSKLTLIDTSENKTGEITNQYIWSGQPLLYNYGELVTSVNFTVPDFETNDGFSQSALSMLNNSAIFSVADSVNFAKNNWNKPSVTINGGTLSGPTQGSIIRLTDSNLTVNGGKFVPNHLQKAPEGYYTACGPEYQTILTVKTLVLNGAADSYTFEEAKEDVQSDLDIYTDFRGSEIVVNGGDFTAFKTDVVVDDKVQDYGDFSIDDKIKIGVAYRNLNSFYEQSTGDTIDTISVTLNDGKWGKDLSAYVPEGKWMELYDPKADEGSEADPYYRIVDANAEFAGASITLGDDTRYYHDFVSAWNVVRLQSEACTVKLYEDVKIEELDLSDMIGEFTLDLNGNELNIEREESISSGHIDLHASSSNTRTEDLVLTVKDSSEMQNGELVLSTPSGGAINTHSFIELTDAHTKFVLESGTIRQVGYFPKNYESTTNNSNQAAQAIFHVRKVPESGASVTVKGGNIISEIHYGTESDHGELKASPYLASWEIETFKYELNFAEGMITDKEEKFVFDLNDYIINKSKMSVVSWNFKDEGEGRAQWVGVANQFASFTFSSYGNNYIVSNLSETDNYLLSSGSRFSTLKEAVQSATPGASIVVLRDNLEVGESIELNGITLDLDFNMQFTLKFTDSAVLTLNGGASIKNGTVEGNIDVSGDAKMEDVTINGNVTVSDGTLTIPSGTYNGAFTVSDSGNMEITGGSFKGSQVKSQTFDKYYGFALGAYKALGDEYDDNTLYTIQIAPNNAAQQWHKSNESKQAFEIGNTDEWLYFSMYVNSGLDNFNGKTVKLTKDLDFGVTARIAATEDAEPNFLPAGNIKNGFVGTFDGGNYTIRGIVAKEIFVGLFGGINYNVGAQPVIKNFTVADSTFIAGTGYLDEYNNDSSYAASSAIIGEGYLGKDGELWSGNITLDHVTVDYRRDELPGKNLFVGGIVGHSWGSVFIDKVNIKNATKLSGTGKVGGIVGYLEGELYIKNADIEQGQKEDGSDNGLILKGSFSGALAGHANGPKNTIEDCTVLESDNSLIAMAQGSMGSAGTGKLEVKGSKTDLDVYRFFGMGRPEECEVVIEGSVTEEEGVIKGSVKTHTQEDYVEYKDEEGNDLDVEFNEDGGVDVQAHVVVDVNIANLQGKATYNGSGDLTFEVESFVLLDKFGHLLEEIGDVSITVTVKLPADQDGIGTYYALINYYTISGADIDNYKFLFNGNQTFVLVTVEAATLTVKVNEDGSVSYDGFVDGEDESVLGGKLHLEKVDNGDGTSTLTPSGLSSQNYNIVYVSGLVNNSTTLETNNDALWIALASVGAILIVMGAVTIIIYRKKNRI